MDHYTQKGNPSLEESSSSGEEDEVQEVSPDGRGGWKTVGDFRTAREVAGQGLDSLRTPTKGEKRPRTPPHYDASDGDEDQPDLASYFSQFDGMSKWAIIACCRTYANYLSAQSRPRTYQKRDYKRVPSKRTE